MVCKSNPSCNMSIITLFTALFFIRSTIAGYVLEDDYTPSNFFSMFSFFTASDPTNGYVDYIDQASAQTAGLINTDSGVYMGVDYTNVASGSGRQSVRLTSNKAYNAGSLIILDLEHMPGGICGTWPAFWMVGPDWPNGGEIDIIEGVHTQTTNDMTLHTADGCSISSTDALMSGSIGTDNCYVYAPDQSTNAVCQIDTTNTATYGAGFNAIGGGAYATLWETTSISIYFFQRGSIPSDISSGSPDPTGWGTPLAQFQGGCDIPEYFYNQSIVFDTTFCGDWAGNTWSSSTCASEASTCDAFVQNNPSAFKDAYWQVNSLQVYQQSSSSASSTVSVPSVAASTSIYIPVSSATSIVDSSSDVNTQYDSSSIVSNVVTSTNVPSSQSDVVTSSQLVSTSTNVPNSQSDVVTSSQLVSTSVVNSQTSVVSSAYVQSTSHSSHHHHGQSVDESGSGQVEADKSSDNNDSSVVLDSSFDNNSTLDDSSSNNNTSSDSNNNNSTTSQDNNSKTLSATSTVASTTSSTITSVAAAATTSADTQDAYVDVASGIVMEGNEQKRSAGSASVTAEKRDAALEQLWAKRLQEEKMQRKARHVRHVGSHNRHWLH